MNEDVDEMRRLIAAWNPVPLAVIGFGGFVVILWLMLAKPFCTDDLEAALSWLRDGISPEPIGGAPMVTLVQRRRPRAMFRRSPTR